MNRGQIKCFRKNENMEYEKMTSQGKNAINVVLAESFKELSEKKPIEKITIKEITDKAGVIRPTFYNHFQDKYELIEWIISYELLEPITPLLNAGMTSEAVVLMLNNVSRNASFYNRAMKMEGPVSFHEIAMKTVFEVFLHIFEEKSTGNPPKYKWLTPERIATYYAQQMCFITENWIKQGMDDLEPREMAEVYMYLISNSMEDVMKDL